MTCIPFYSAGFPCRKPLATILLAAVPLLLGGVVAPGAIAQVTNQSDTSGANPDVIFPIPLQLPDQPGLSEAGRDLADLLGQAYQDCATSAGAAQSLQTIELPDVGAVTCDPCGCLEQLLDASEAFLNDTDQDWEEVYQEARNRLIW